MLGVGLGQAAGSPQGQAILGEEHRLGEMRNPSHEIIGGASQLARRVLLLVNLIESVASVSVASGDRPCCQPPCMADRVFRISVRDAAVAVGTPADAAEVALRPARSSGAMLAWRTRRGKPLASTPRPESSLP